MQPTGARTPGYRSPRLLPPIPNGEASSSTGEYRSTNSGERRTRSRYHSGCVERSPSRPDCSSRGPKKKNIPFLCTCIATSSQILSPPELPPLLPPAQAMQAYQAKQHSRDAAISAVPHKRSHGRALTRAARRVPNERSRARFGLFRDGDGVELMNYLDRNRDLLEAYVVEAVPIEELERWFFRKIKYNFIDDTSSYKSHSNTKLPELSSTKPTFINLVKNLKGELSEHSVLWELANTITSTVGVDAFRIYKLFPDHPSFVQCLVHGNEAKSPLSLDRADPEQVVLALEVAKKMTSLRVSRHEDPIRFPDTPTALFKSSKKKERGREANHILYQPILTSTGKTGYVIEMWRVQDRFRELDEQISANFMLWGSLALHYCNMYLDKKRERNMSDFLLDVVKAIFEEMVSLDQLIKRILEFAQRLVNADRASLFLVDYRNFELVSTVFDLRFEPGHDGDLEKKEIRMPINRGIAGHVALSGETMNIPDAYSDYRFNREVDEATGYKTISILCMPVKVEGKVIGVVQMVNKRNDDNFDREDEVSFEIFSTFFGLALHHARLYDRIMRKEQKYRVALEVLSYHNTCREYEVQAMLSDKEDISVNLNDFALDPYKFTEFQKCKSVITMFDDLFDLSKFDSMTLTRFVLTVKKNYRAVPYHNFDHGWSVAHAMYVILKNDTVGRFDYTRRLALFVSSLCHDLDHRGYTNKYMSETASPLAAMYTTSTLEHHHFNITVTILQQDGHNIFAHISSEEYKEILGFIRQAILATDLAAFFPNLAKIKELHSEGNPHQFHWEIPGHKDLAMAISMTAADLSASAKPWGVQIKTVKVIFEEFYDQGDKERAIGKTPISMMDRNMPEEQPASQVGFLSQICIPCYTMLYKILPHTEEMYNMAMKNLERWKSRAEIIANKGKYAFFESYEDDEEIPELFDALEISESSSFEEAIKNDDEPQDKTVPVEPAVGRHSCDKRSDVDTISWEEEESHITDAITESAERLNGFWKEADEAEWIDEEGVVVKSNSLKGVIKNVSDQPQGLP